MMSFGIGAWLAAHLHMTSARQQEISASLKRAHEQNCAANKRNIEASERAIAEPLGDAKAGIENLLCNIHKSRKKRREKSI